MHRIISKEKCIEHKEKSEETEGMYAHKTIHEN